MKNKLLNLINMLKMYKYRKRKKKKMFVLCLDMSLDVLLVFRSILKQAPVCLCKPFLNLLLRPTSTKQ